MALNITLTITNTLELDALVDALEHSLDVQLSQLTEDTDLKKAEWDEFARKARATRSLLYTITGNIQTQPVPTSFEKRRR